LIVILKKNYEILVVGSGLSGVTCARVFAEKGYKTLVVEKMKQLGGQVFDYKNEAGITVHRHGPHIFHTNLKHVWDFVNRFSSFSDYQHRVLSYVDGKFFPFPINRDTLNQVFGLNLSDDEVPAFLKEEVQKSTFSETDRSFRDAVVSQVGERLYRLFFEKYTKKQWNRDPETLSAEIAGRIPVRNTGESRYFTDTYQGMPVDGYSAMIEKMLSHENIHILSGCDYFEIKNCFDPELTIYTGKLDEFFNYKYGQLDYRSLKFEFKTFDEKSFQPASVVNYPNDYDYTRTTEFKKMTGDESSKTTVCFEYPSETGLPFYPVLNAANLAVKAKYQEEAAQLEAGNKFIFTGRLAEYKYYNMDTAIDSALLNVEKWLQSKHS
jgi:UDP-galactopyranose mutase